MSSSAPLAPPVVIARLPARLVGDARRLWADLPAPHRLLAGVGLLLMLIGIFSIGIFAVKGGPLDGPISWRKPVLFSLAIGGIQVAVAWVASHARMGPRTAWVVLGTTALLGATQTLLVNVQQWRGTMSHFNMFTTDLNAMIAIIIAVSTIPVTIFFILLTIWSYTRLTASAPVRSAIRYGMVMVSLGALQGLTMIAHAFSTVPSHISPHPHAPYIMGEAGVLLVPHLVALHGLLLVMLLSLVLHYRRRREPERLRSLRLAMLGYTVLWLVQMGQAYRGLAPLDLHPMTAVLMAGASILLLAVFITAAFRPALGQLRGRSS